jgi:UDP-GlcNAc:undecaprenyl-phosphate GlcNAc-1-phosphate transferase
VNNPSTFLYVCIFIFSLITSSLLVPLLKNVAFRYSILDKPNQVHKTHKFSIPYLGGLSIVIPILILAITGPLILAQDSDYQIRLTLLLAPAIVLAVLGLFDDIKNLSAFSRFLVQTILSLISTLYLFDLGYGVSITNYSTANLLISIFWLVGITNAFNFFDNLDGGAAGITVVSSLTLFLLALIGVQYLVASLALALAGASLGFLFWNRSPAQIYLGDSGALFIGFLLALSLLQFEPGVESQFASALIPIFVMALPIIDTTVAVISRFSRGISIFQGGRDHLSHRLISLGMSRKKSAYTLWTLAIAFSSLSLVSTIAERRISVAISLLGLTCMGLIAIWFLRISNDT